MARIRALAAAQTTPIRGDVAANVAEHVQLARLAAREGAQVVLFPELSLTGYELDLGAELAFAERDARLAPLIDAAATHGVTLIVGAPVSVDAQLYIGAFIVRPDRELALYTKHHLAAFAPEHCAGAAVPPAEDSVFQPGTRNPLVRFGDQIGAVSVCADSLHRSHPQRAAELGARIYYSSQFAIPIHLEPKLTLLKKQAVRFGLTIVFSNFGGPTAGLISAGGSGIWSEQAECVAQLGARGSGLALGVQDEAGWHGTTLSL